jgi:methionyl-tRNA synthetase
VHPVYIGVAWPYANGGLHLGHVAGSLLPPDIFRRYCRMAGHDVLMVSGSDCHGTPILLKAEAEGKQPQDIVEHFHADHARALERLNIGFDLFTRTTTENHKEWVQRIFSDLRAAGYIETRTEKAPYDPKARRFLPDRYVEGTCPHCQAEGARGDQCDRCGKTLDPQELREPRSKLNPETAIEFRDTEHFFFLLSKLQPKLEAYVQSQRDHWRPNTINFTENWLREGLKDRPITRDLSWGIPIPIDGYEDKRIYVWFEAVCGYLSAAVEWASKGADPAAWQRWWTDPQTRSYYFLGKDNIPFHTIIWPAILIAFNEARVARGEAPLVLPYDVPANEFLNLDGKQFSKSRGISIAVHDVLNRFEADAVRYYLSINMPEQRDADWTWDDFLAKVNDELVGILGNLVHRTLSFTHNNLKAIPPGADTPLDARVQAAIEACSKDMADDLQNVRLKKAARRLLEFAGWGNQTMQEVAPWKLLKEDRDAGTAALYSLLRVVKALTLFMAPFLPHAAERAWSMLGENGSVHEQPWSAATAPLQSGHALAPPEALFRKLDPKDIPQAAPAASAAADKAPAAGAASPAGKPGDKPAAAPSATTNATQSPGDGLVSFDEFGRIQLRLATIKSVEPHPNADKLYVLKLDVGALGERQVVAGLKAYYQPDELVGKTVAFVANLKPAKLRGIESQGMILAADHDGSVAVLTPQRPLPAGSTIR